jgi:uncharacterized membrane protein YdjX (TVP38/TMEM64 family)
VNTKHLKKFVIVITVVILIAVFELFDLGRYLNLSYLKASQKEFATLYSGHKELIIAGYMTVYILVTSLSLPGAAIMTLAGGALFGLLTGTFIVSFSSSIGATLACFISRSVLRDWVQDRFGAKLKTVNAGIEREGAFYLFSLRLIPVFPFWLINLIMGLTKMPLRTFYWVSQTGMLPGTIIYVNAGKELAKVDSLSGIFSPGLILSFVLLGLFPIATKKLLDFYREKKTETGKEKRRV